MKLVLLVLLELMMEMNWWIDNIRVIRMFKVLLYRKIFFIYCNFFNVFVYKEKDEIIKKKIYLDYIV